jgi:hypothetical protein
LTKRPESFILDIQGWLIKGEYLGGSICRIKLAADERDAWI